MAAKRSNRQFFVVGRCKQLVHKSREISRSVGSVLDFQENEPQK